MNAHADPLKAFFDKAFNDARMAGLLPPAPSAPECPAHLVPVPVRGISC